MKNFKSHTIKITPDQSKDYFHAEQLILSNGFEYEGQFENWNVVSGIFTKKIYRREKDGKLFAFAGMDHYNTKVYSFKMREFIGDECNILINY